MVENLREKALAAYTGIFNDQDFIEVSGKRYYLQYTSFQQLRKFTIEGYNYIEQNPNKASRWGEMAQKGHRILWVCRGPAYLYQVVDGQFRSLRKKKKN